MVSRLRFNLLLFIAILVTACSSQTEHKMAKICCGRVFDTTIKGVYQTDINNEKISLSHGILFTGLAVTDNFSAYEYEIHGDVIEFWRVELVNGNVRRYSPDNMVRRSWYFFGFEPMEYLSVVFLPLFDFGFEYAPVLTMKINDNKSSFSSTESRLVHCKFFKFANNPIAECSKHKPYINSVWNRV